MATLQNIGKLKYRGKDGQWHPLPVVVQDTGGGVSTISGKGAPTSETQGEVNQLYRDEDTQKLYICTSTDGGYTWAAVVSDTEDAVTYTAQTLTNAQKTQARANIGAGTSNFSGSYNDLSNKPNIPAATVIDTTLTKSGQAADAKAAGDAIGKKIDKAQGTGNAGKILGIGADGNVTPQDKPAQELYGPSAPTNATAGVVGQEYYVIANGVVTEMYVCTAAENGTYTWDRVEFGAEIDDTSTEPTKVWSAEKCNQLSEEIADCIKSPTTAEVGQIVKIAAVDDAGKPTAWEAVDLPEQVQADWNQNDNTAADYVKNRTHWVKYGLDVAGFTITLPISADETTHDDIPFEVGQTWSVVSNKNVSYNCTVEKADDGTVYIGAYPSPGYYGTAPFYVSTTKVMGDSMWVGRDGNTSITLTCLSNADIYHTIPFEYFPDAIFSQESSPVKFGTDDSGNIIKTASVQGDKTKASKECSHAEGNSTTASGSSSHAEGEHTKASGYCSHAGGYYTEASANYSHAEGEHTKASGYCSHAGGYYTEASGKYSHAEGEQTKASGYCSHAGGCHTVAVNARQTVCGSYNKYYEDKYTYERDSSTLYAHSTDQYSAADSFEFDGKNGVFTLINPTTYDYNTIPIGKYVIKNNDNNNMYKILSIQNDSSNNFQYKTSRFYKASPSDVLGEYIHIVGNGKSNNTRSNAYTLDWNGVPWFQGRPQFGGAEQDDGSQTVVANGDSEIILSSPGGKKFSVKVDDSGTLSATEVV